MISRRRYRSDVSDARWALIEPALSAWRAARAEAGLGLAAPVHELREIVNAILYVNRTGIAWEYLPHDFPPYKTVYDYYAKWEKEGLTEAIHDLLRGKVRERAGRAAGPTAAIIDAQSVKTSGNVAESSQGIDAGKKIKGRRRHIATDTIGLLLAAVVTAASVRNHDPLGDDRQHEPAAHRRIHHNLARRPSAIRRTITDLDQMPSKVHTGDIACAVGDVMALNDSSSTRCRTSPPRPRRGEPE